jgi:hypothetical protein
MDFDEVGHRVASDPDEGQRTAGEVAACGRAVRGPGVVELPGDVHKVVGVPAVERLRAMMPLPTPQTPEAGDQRLHEIRMMAKHARYAAESASPVVGKPARRLAGRMRTLQDVVGEHQDSVAARALTARALCAAHMGDENGFTYGVMDSAERALARQASRAYSIRAAKGLHHKGSAVDPIKALGVRPGCPDNEGEGSAAADRT